jgi:acetyltransferase-like isoleucine patch superfamily enzyme
MGYKQKILNILPTKLYDCFVGNKTNVKNVIIEREKTALRRTVVNSSMGKNNKIIVSKGAHLFNCTFHFIGDNNVVFIGENCNLNQVKFWLEDSNNQITIGNRTTTSGYCEFACIEGTEITIGEDCMFSSDIRVCTGDSHSILQEGKRINHSQNIDIGNHVWVGTRVDILKGSTIANDSVVGARALVSGTFANPNSILGGIPAKIIKENISWERERL